MGLMAGWLADKIHVKLNIDRNNRLALFTKRTAALPMQLSRFFG